MSHTLGERRGTGSKRDPAPIAALDSASIQEAYQRWAGVYDAVFGGVSSFTFWDARAAYTLNPHLELALGIDNLTDSRGYQAHPYPGRTVFLEVRARQ